MKVLAINASPRKNWNTQKLLDSALEGAKSLGAETEMIDLYDTGCMGCVSCFACKVKNSRTNGVCAQRDDMRPVLEKAREADVILVGSPVYFDMPTAGARAFLERFLFPLDSYNVVDGVRQRFLDKIVPSAFIFTMNCPRDLMAENDYETILSHNEKNMGRLLGYCETLYSCDTYQYKDYSRMDGNMFKEEAKAKHRDEQFPVDLQNAYDLGVRLVNKAKEENPELV
jgi:multimeric flavodoxin WrbA